ncbi:acyltransferase family protein [Gordonia caeni]|uniref:Acyltransferase family protein n=1 Tax=Gordonia caeni TaxID=1007097 RepID=A0ABP7P547_9ACTN
MSTDTVSTAHRRAAGTSAPRRSDIEGLRGVAIMLVVIFHIWVGTVSGGVDAFLFISGFFLIPSLLRAQLGTDPVNNPLPRVWRVLKRLWIPMAATVAVTVLATWFIYPSSRRAETLIDALWSDLFVENWALGLAGDTYADATSLPSPFQHLWSLAVQAQVFIVLIGGLTLAGLALRRAAARGLFSVGAIRPILVTVLVAGTLASFGWATFAGPANQTLNYYNTFSRFWEIALGGLVGLVLTKLAVAPWARQLAGVVGLAMLVATGLVVDGATSFPGPAALLPLGGTVLVFLAGAGGTSVTTRALSARPMVYLGAIAYPLYLWHWPLLMMFLVYRNYHGTPVHHVNLLDGLAIVAVSLLLAALSNFLLKADSPIRRLRARTPVVLTATVAALIVAVQAWLVPVQMASADSIDWRLHPGAAATAGEPTPAGVEFLPQVEASRADLPQTAADGCFNDGQKTADLVICDYGAPREPGRKVLSLIGGSHAEHFLPALDAIGAEHDFTVETVVMAGCSMGSGPAADEAATSDRCRDWQRNAMDHLLTTRPDAVFTNSTRPAAEFGTGDQVPARYIDVFVRLADAGIPVVGVRDLPWLMTPDGEKREPFDCMAVRDDPVACGVQRSLSLSPEDPAVAALGDLPGVSLLDFSDLHCGPDDCPVVVGNVLVYRDAHHFTKTFVLTMKPFIERDLGEALGWFPDRH